MKESIRIFFGGDVFGSWNASLALHILYTILLDIGARRDRDSVAQRGRGK